jgi:hypothetical protein
MWEVSTACMQNEKGWGRRIPPFRDETLYMSTGKGFWDSETCFTMIAFYNLNKRNKELRF